MKKYKKNDVVDPFFEANVIREQERFIAYLVGSLAKTKESLKNSNILLLINGLAWIVLSIILLLFVWR